MPSYKSLQIFLHTMPTTHAFPWGIYIGELTKADADDIPVVLPAETGGFWVDYDTDSQAIASHFIENVVLLLAESLPPQAVQWHVFDFDIEPRFRYLSQLKTHGLYHLYADSEKAKIGFNNLENTARHRLHELLSPEVATISEYNQSSNYPEAYHIALINADYYPDDLIGTKRIKALFDSAAKAGIYTIIYHATDSDEDSTGNREKSLTYLRQRFASLCIHHKTATLSPELFEFTELCQFYDYELADANHTQITKQLISQLTDSEQQHGDSDFLQIPIAKTQDGRQDIYFSLGARSQNYNAFIIGRVGSGKSVLLNNLIVGIAERYTAQQIQLYLMDYKNGVEFSVYKNHPNCVKLFLDENDFTLAVGMIDEFTHELQLRGNIFDQAQVKDIATYNQAHPNTPLAHKILIIDEAHRLFTGGIMQKKHFVSSLDYILRQGRSYGLHIILVTQTLVGSDISSDLLGQIPLRIAFKLNEEKDTWQLFAHGNDAARHLDAQKYEVLINTDSGNKKANQIGLANPPLAFKEKERPAIENKLQQIRASRLPQQVVTPEVLKGQPIAAEDTTVENNAPTTNSDKPDWLDTEGK